MEYPKISVVTVTFNDVNGLKKTIESVLGLTYEHVEYIVIDGGSTDGTVDLLDQYRDQIDLIVSEPDAGIYDAMNKGISRITGEYAIFMNAGDVFTSPTVVSEVAESFGEKVGVFYGHRFYVNKKGRKLQKSHDVSFISRRMPYCHQSAFYRAELLRNHPFNETYKYAADYNQVVELYKNDIVFKQLDMPICDYAHGGKSESGIRPYLEVLKIQFDNFAEEDMKQSVYMSGLIKNFDALIGKYRADVIPVKTAPAAPTQPKRPLPAPTLPKNNQGVTSGQERTALRDVFASEEIKKILFADLHALRGKTTEEKLKILKIWQRDFIMSEFVLPKVKDGDALFFRSMVRDDYRNMFHTVIDASGLKNPIVVEDYKIRKNKLNLQASRFLVDHMDLSNTLDISCPIDRSCAFIRLVQYGFILEHFKHAKLGVLVCHADMQPVEHLLAWYFRSKGVPTVTMQHGLYVDYENYDTVNRINYLHHASEYFLSWGGDTEKLIHKYHTGANVIICGKPLVTVSEKCNTSASEKITGGYCTVIFDQKIFDEENMQMLKLASEYAKKYKIGVNVKFHPQNNRGKFRSSGIKFDESFDIMKSKFIVGHTSSLLYEMMGRGMKVFKYWSKAPCLPTPAQITVSNLRDLEKSINSKFDYENQFSKYISYTGSDSLGQYRKAFENIVVEKQA